MGGVSTLEQTRKPRPAGEWFCDRVFRPLAQRLVDPAARLGLRPTRLVLLHTGLGLLAAWHLRHGQSFLSRQLSPALLLQLKTVLDNLDGQLARATGQTSEAGRYLDSEMDVVVNLTLFTALLGRGGAPATLLLGLILSADYLWERDYRQARGEEFRAAPAQGGDHPALLALLRGLYALYFAPQERLLGGLFERRLVRALGRPPEPEDRRRYTPLLLCQVSANLGLSSQLLALGAAVLAGRPGLYLGTLPLQALTLAGLQLWREGLVATTLAEGGLMAGGTAREGTQLPAAPADSLNP